MVARGKQGRHGRCAAAWRLANLGGEGAMCYYSQLLSLELVLDSLSASIFCATWLLGGGKVVVKVVLFFVSSSAREVLSGGRIHRPVQN
jgi:hypothetical protein